MAGLALAAPAQGSSIRHVSFANLSYPAPDTNVTEVGLTLFAPVPLDRSGRTVILRGAESRNLPQGVEYTSVRLQSVAYGSTRGIPGEVALVALSLRSGGSLNWGALYVFAGHGRTPVPLCVLSLGDGANGGLRRAYTHRGNLVIQLYGRENQRAAYCTAGLSSRTFRWTGAEFQQIGQP